MGSLAVTSHDWKFDRGADVWVCDRCLAATFDSVAYSPAICPGKPRVPVLNDVVTAHLCTYCGRLNDHSLECYEPVFWIVKVKIVEIGEQRSSFVGDEGEED